MSEELNSTINETNVENSNQAPAVPETMSEEQVVETTSNNQAESDTEKTVEKDNNLSLDEVERLAKFINTEVTKEALNEQMNQISKSKTEMLNCLAGLDNKKDFISENLAKFSNVKELTEYLKNPDHIKELYTNPDTGEVIDLSINIESEARAKDFKRELLIYLKTSDDASAMIDKEFDELNKATNEMNADINEVCMQLSDNVLTYASHLENKANACNDEVLKNKVLKTVKYIKAGYDLSVFKEVLKEHPSVIPHTVKELESKYGIERTGRKYNSKLKSHNVKVSLIPLISNKPKRLSIEEQVLIKDDEYTIPDLFMYSIIRFFSMADWNDSDVRKAHASIALVMKRLLNNEFEHNVRESILTAMVEYIHMFA